jgi:hypothetical protein
MKTRPRLEKTIDLPIVIARAKRRSNPFSLTSAKKAGLLRGACHRARVRATRWLAMTLKYSSSNHGEVVSFPLENALRNIRTIKEN